MRGNHFSRSVSPIGKCDVQQALRRPERRLSPMCMNEVDEGEDVSNNISNDNNALFDAQPAIINFPKIDQNNGDPLDFGLRRVAGDLRFTPKAGVYGKARVSLSITDDGGNTSDTKHVYIYPWMHPPGRRVSR